MHIKVTKPSSGLTCLESPTCQEMCYMCLFTFLFHEQQNTERYSKHHLLHEQLRPGEPNSPRMLLVFTCSFSIIANGNYFHSKKWAGLNIKFCGQHIFSLFLLQQVTTNTVTLNHTDLLSCSSVGLESGMIYTGLNLGVHGAGKNPFPC